MVSNGEQVDPADLPLNKAHSLMLMRSTFGFKTPALLPRRALTIPRTPCCTRSPSYAFQSLCRYCANRPSFTVG
jgi:hypothetical protein